MDVFCVLFQLVPRDGDSGLFHKDTAGNACVNTCFFDLSARREGEVDAWSLPDVAKLRGESQSRSGLSFF